MFFHLFLYNIKVFLGSKVYLFWCLCFPIVLGTLFYIAFGNLSEGEDFAPIQTAVVMENDTSPEASLSEIQKVLDELSAPGDGQLLEITYASMEEAKELLREKKVSGILTVGDEITLLLSGEMSYDKLNQSILQTFVESFQSRYDAVQKVAGEHPEKLNDVITVLNSGTEYSEQITYTGSNMDESLTYFFNLIAMTCLMGCTAGSTVAVANQANLSALAMRKNISPTRKPLQILAELSAAVLIQFFVTSVSVLYLWLVLKVDLGDRAGYIFLTVLAGSVTAVSGGFLVGSIGKLDEDTKVGILMGVTMLCSFLSGLMVGGMRLLVERYAPFVNRINPAALISDSLYSLAVYGSPARYFQNIGTLFAMAGIFFLAGTGFIRRTRYASL